MLPSLFFSEVSIEWTETDLRTQYPDPSRKALGVQRMDPEKIISKNYAVKRCLYRTTCVKTISTDPEEFPASARQMTI